MGGLYLHIPFCQSKCGYCAFYSLVGHESYIGDFAGAIVNELDGRLSEMALPVDTIYIGGGTPVAACSGRVLWLGRFIEESCMCSR